MLYLIYVVHCLSCCWVFIGYITPGSWIWVMDNNVEDTGKGATKAGFDAHSFPAVYIRSIYFIITSLTTVGYGDYHGYTNDEYMF